MAGWNTSEMLDGVQSTLNLAKIGAIDLGSASDILTDDLTALGMSANQAGDFADKLSATITRSNTNVSLFGESMKQVGSIAGALGISMTDLSTSIGIMANAGNKGSTSGMALKNMLTRMSSPTKKVTEALQELGMVADESGSYLKTTADGYTDLEGTINSLKSGMDGMTRSQKASLLATIAGKEALPGVMSLINTSTKDYNELSDAIDNSTSTVAMFNENMSILGLSGSGATDAIQNMKQVFSDTELSATSLGLSSKDLGFSISLLGDDSKVTAKNVEELLDVVESMNSATGKTDKAWRNIGSAEGLDINKYIDYNSTLSEIDNSIVGLSASKKDYVKSLIKENMTVAEANKVLKSYGLSAKQVSLSTLTTSEKMDYLRSSLKGMSDEQMKSELGNLGLAESFDEVNEIVDMSDEKYDKYKKNLQTIQGLSDRLAKSMDETTVASFKALSSAMQDSLIGAFDRMKPALLGASEALTDFFGTWRGQDGNYSFAGLEKGLDSLEIKVSQVSKNIPGAMDSIISSMNTFISGGSLDSILNMGGDIVQGICNGIIQNKNNISQGISDLIGKVCDWINTNGPAIEEAGKTIINGLKNGISNNANNLNSAVDTVFNIVNSFLIAKQDLLQTTGAIVGSSFITGMVKGIAIEGVNSIGNAIFGIVNTIGSFIGDIANAGISLATGFVDGFMGFMLDCGLWDGIKQSVMELDLWMQENGLGGGTTKAQDAGFNYGKSEGVGRNKALEESKGQTDATASQIGDGISQNIMNKLETMDASQLKVLEDSLKSLQTTTSSVATGIGQNFTKIQNSARTSFMGLANIARNQFTSMSNIINNQCQNARNNMTRAFISMSAVARNQCSNIRTTVVSKFMSIASVVGTQSWKARDNATRAFISLASVVRTQMANALASVRSHMASIVATTSQSLNLKVNVSKTITTTTVEKPGPKSVQLNATRSLSKVNALATYNTPATLVSRSRSGTGISSKKTFSESSNNKANNSKPIQIDVPINLDGREIAKASAKYMDGELQIINNRNNRKKGV